jgi:hypothetical protein
MNKITVLIIVLSIVFLTGCISVEKKIYRIQLTGPNSGHASITFINIVSQKDNDRDVSMKDFAELVTDYVEGPKVEDDYPNATNFKKRLFEENNQLCAEFTFDFDSLSIPKLFRLDDKSPLMLFVKDGTNNEKFASSNGVWGGDNMPVVFWKSTDKNLEWEINVQTDFEKTVPLVEDYRSWKNKNKK